MHHSTPKKAKIQGVCDFNDAHGIPYSHNDVFRWAGVSKTKGWSILRENRILEPRTFHTAFRETRGRKRKFSEADLDAMEHVIASTGPDGRALHYEDLPAAAGLDIDASRETIRLALKAREFRRCLVCQKSYVSPHLAERRKAWAKLMLERYPTKEHWRHVRFSDETHFGWGPEGKVWVLRRPWEKNCPDCVVEKTEPKSKDLKRLHAWAAVGYNFKSPLVWYDVPGNTNGRMSLQVYRDVILEPIVGNWLREGHQFVLEEDNDPGHGTGKNNMVRAWKKQANLTSFFNCSSSPDIPPIEKAWIASKQNTRGKECWDDHTLKELAEEGHNALKQETINNWVDLIPKILRDIIDSDGKMTVY